MITLLLIIWGVLTVGLLLVAAVRPEHSKHSLFELKRRGDEAVLRRERLLNDINALLRAVEIFLIIVLSVLAWTIAQTQGIITVIVALLLIVPLSRWKPVTHYAMNLYHGQEKQLLRFVEQFSWIGWFLNSDRRQKTDPHLESQEQLLHLVESAGHILSEDQQKLIKRGLDWHTTEIKKVMTPVGDIISVSKGELLGPLVLNDLHESGHHRFPVTNAGIHHVVGQINISELLELDAGKKTETAGHVMTPLEVRLYPDTPLPEALRQLLDHPGQLGLVVNDDGQTEGLVSLRDILGALLGKRF
jgi:CBS domain containing-hemolysin-like protein